MNTLLRRISSLSLRHSQPLTPKFNASIEQVRENTKWVRVPKPGCGKQYRRLVNYPDEYTIKPLSIRHLAGRDPVTGRVVVAGIGGGIKHSYHWVQWVRDGPAEGPPRVDIVIDILKDGCRTAHVALIGSGEDLKYILATENMKIGDLLRTSREIPRIPVRANEGDAYPLGALPIGTRIHNVQTHPDSPFTYAHAAGTFATILRKFEDKVVVKMPTKREFALLETCMVTVGRVSNIHHDKEHIGSAQNSRLMGNRPRSGLWHRKEGRHGRKIRPLPPLKVVTGERGVKAERIELTRHDVK